MIKIIVVDDHELVREGIIRVLAEASDLHVAGEGASGEEALELVRRERPQVVLMDLRMPGIGGLEATRRIARSRPECRVIVLTVCDQEPFPSQLFRAGAAGYLTKKSAATEAVHAVRRVASGQKYVSPDVAQALALDSFGGVAGSPFSLLSGRELQIALMVANCRRVAEISTELHLSPKTVNSYRYRVFEKLGVSSDVELAVMAMRHGLVESYASRQDRGRRSA